MSTNPTSPDCPAAILRRHPLELAEPEPDERTVIIEPDKMPPDLRELVAEVRRFLGSRNA